MRICDICYAEIKGEGEEICDRCKDRKSAKVLMEEEQLPDEKVIERFKELMYKREENIELLTSKLRCMSKNFNLI